MPPRRIVLLAFAGAQTLDVVGPTEVFSAATRLAPGSYTVELVTAGSPMVETSSGLRLVGHRTLRGCRGPIDTLLVAGGLGVRAAERDEQLIGWLRAAARRTRRIASVCTGAFLLARAGLLEGRRATTHWASCDDLARRHPCIAVERDPIFVRDGNVWTSAGVTAGMDLALALVEDDYGRELALEVARWLVLFVTRPGGQSQFSAQLSAQLAEQEPLRELQAWISDNPATDLSVPALAARACMSERNFARVFAREVGQTPAAYVERVRVEHARRELESTDAPVDVIARRSGFGTAESLRRAFHRRLQVGPTAYRDRFRGRTAA